jgi:hypothetical protein
MYRLKEDTIRLSGASQATVLSHLDGPVPATDPILIFDCGDADGPALRYD